CWAGGGCESIARRSSPASRQRATSAGNPPRQYSVSWSWVNCAPVVTASLTVTPTGRVTQKSFAPVGGPSRSSSTTNWRTENVGVSALGYWNQYPAAGYQCPLAAARTSVMRTTIDGFPSSVITVSTGQNALSGS